MSLVVVEVLVVEEDIPEDLVEVETHLQYHHHKEILEEVLLKLFVAAVAAARVLPEVLHQEILVVLVVLV
jgi:hypothetical protein